MAFPAFLDTNVLYGATLCDTMLRIAEQGAFPLAAVEDYDLLVDAMTCDPQDRHVLAAAVQARCEVVVTFNVKDFPPESTGPHQISVVTPDAFLLDQLDLHPPRRPGAMSSVIRVMSLHKDIGHPQRQRLVIYSS